MRRAWLFVTLIILGCKSEPAKLVQVLEQSSSGLATAASVGRATAANRTPVRYADDTIDETLQELERATSRLDELTVGAALRVNAKALIERTIPTLVQLRAALRAHSPDIRTHTVQLSMAADSLDSLADEARDLER